mmetsp:Transcript_15103/g.28638  ORF Transcript_15103/g.28638 Transcript_15103/m.28638 type:complete len:266 (-) Transcript_15103:197-994(-)|eukprot:scaffold9526_cov247-Amphora_coffeaeformis.AAC.3
MDGISTICARLQRNDPSLTVLNLNHQDIGNDSCKDLAAALTTNTHLVVLFLDNNFIGTSGVQALATTLASHPRLTHLNLSYNRIDDDGCMALATLLRQSPSLQVVKLMDNDIGAAGGRALAGALGEPSCSLTTLSLSNNDLRDKGVLAFCQALRCNRSLTYLNLRDNRVRNERRITQAWLDLLQSNTNMTLRRLYLWTRSDSEKSVIDGWTELNFWLRWNRAGRRSLAPTAQHVPVVHLLARAASLQSVLMATLQARPDLLNLDI